MKMTQDSIFLGENECSILTVAATVGQYSFQISKIMKNFVIRPQKQLFCKHPQNF
jgi:hypothetical protein